MAEQGAAGSMSGSAVAELQKSISKLVEDMGKLNDLSKSFATNMRAAARSGGGMSGGGGGSSQFSFTTQSAQAGGFGAPLASGNTGRISDTGSMNPGLGSQLAGLGWQTFKGVSVGAFNDLLPSAEQATNMEWLSRRARFGGVAYQNFDQVIKQGINKYNIMNPDIYMGDVTEAMHMGMGASMGIGRANPATGATAGQLLASQNIGSFHTLAAMGGLDASQVSSAVRGVYGSQAYYRSMAGGVMTRDTSGRMIGVEGIVNQYARRFNGSPEELDLAFEYGGMHRLELESTFGEAGAETIISGLKERARLNRDLNPNELQEQMGPQGTGAAGSPWSQALDTRSALFGSQIDVLSEYRQSTTAGVAAANEIMTGINEGLANLPEPLKSVAEGLAALKGSMDAFNTTMPSTTGAVTSAIGGLLSLLGGGMSLFGRSGGGGIGGQGGRGLVGTARGEGLLNSLRYGGAKTYPGGNLPGSLPLTRSMGARAMGVVGRLGAGGLAFTATHALEDARSSPDRDWGAVDTLGTIAGYAGTGALMGSVLGPWGALAGGVIGAGYGAWQSWHHEKNDLERGGGSYGTPGFAEGKWIVEKDQNANIHQGEMILPSRIAEAVRKESDTMRRSSGGTSVVINLTVASASDQQAMAFAARVKRIIDEDQEMMTAGEGMLR